MSSAGRHLNYEMKMTIRLLTFRWKRELYEHNIYIFMSIIYTCVCVCVRLCDKEAKMYLQSEREVSVGQLVFLFSSSMCHVYSSGG